MPSFPTFSKRRKMRNDDEGSDGLWGINFGCIAVGPKLGWGHFSSAPNAPTLWCFSAFSVWKLPTIVICSSRWLVDWRSSSNPVIRSSTASLFSQYHTHIKSNESEYKSWYVEKWSEQMVLPHPSIVSDEEGRGLGALTHSPPTSWETTRQKDLSRRELDKKRELRRKLQAKRFCLEEVWPLSLSS